MGRWLRAALIRARRHGGVLRLVVLAPGVAVRAGRDQLRGRRAAVHGGRDSGVAAVAASRLGRLFTIVGYLSLVPYILVNLANPVACAIGDASEGVYVLPWPIWAWPGRAGGCGRGSSAGWSSPITCRTSRSTRPRRCSGVPRSAAATPGARPTCCSSAWFPAGLQHAQHDRRARRARDNRHRPDPDRQAVELRARLVPADHDSAVVDQPGGPGRGHLDREPVQFSGLVTYALLPLVLLAGPALFVISTVRSRTAGGALGTAIVDLEPGASPGHSGTRWPGRWVTRRCSGRPAAGGAGHLDTSGQAVDADRPDNGRAVVPIAARTGPSWSTTRDWSSSRSWSS